MWVILTKCNKRSRFDMENFVMLSFLLVVYLYLLIKVWSNLVTKAYPKIFKYIKKGMSEKEETRATGMRMLLKLHFNDSI